MNVSPHKMSSLWWLFKIVHDINRFWHFYKMNFFPVVCTCFYFYTAFGCHFNNVAHHAVLGKFTAFTVSAAVHFGVWFPFLGCQRIEIIPSWKIKLFFPRCTICQALACKITQAKIKDGTTGTFPTQRLFEGFLLNSRDNIQTLPSS